jgi:anti-sigma regulatory factor (Ser/Thr protein kinase)
MDEIDCFLESGKDFHDLFSLTRIFAEDVGIKSQQTANLVLAVSEIATNALRYCGSAQVTIRHTANKKGMEIVVTDKGPGIADVDKAMVDGFSTFSDASLGLGLGAAKRCVDELSINTSSQGTSITLRAYLSGHYSKVDIGVASYPKVGETLNGDRYLIKEYEGDKLLLCVIDGVGHGQKAYKAASLVSSVVDRDYKKSIDHIILSAHKMLSGSSEQYSAELAIARITETDIEYGALGSPVGFIYSDPKCSLKINNGRIGISLPSEIYIDSFPRPDKFILALQSDGISKRYFLADFSSISSAQIIAETIFNQYATSADDATIVVMRG